LCRSFYVFTRRHFFFVRNQIFGNNCLSHLQGSQDNPRDDRLLTCRSKLESLNVKAGRTCNHTELRDKDFFESYVVIYLEFIFSDFTLLRAE
jgi:hypothetical protein